MWESNFIIKYNNLLDRYYKAEEFFNSSVYVNKDGEICEYKSLEEEIKKKERWVGELQKIVRELSKMMIEYKQKTGFNMSEEEILKGFKY